MRKHYVVSLEKKDHAKYRTWQLRVDSGKKTPSGAISWKTRKVTGKTWTQANELCDEWAVGLDEGRAVIPDRKWTFREYREHWIGLLRDLGIASANTVHLREASLKAAGMHLDGYRLEVTRHFAKLRQTPWSTRRPGRFCSHRAQDSRVWCACPDLGCGPNRNKQQFGV